MAPVAQHNCLSKLAASLVQRSLILDIEKPCLIARFKVRHANELILSCHLQKTE
jgi:hypothetical protein